MAFVMRGFEGDLGPASLIGRLQEPARAEAPCVAGVQTIKSELGPRGAEVIANIFRIGEKFGGHYSADRVAALIFGAGVAHSIAVKAGDRIGAA